MGVKDPSRAFHIMAKPTGSACNLNCDYCFFLKKERLYPGSNFRMSDDVHEAYIKQLFEAHQTPQVTVAWQGGEPTLMGLDFFQRSMELQKKYQKPGTQVENTFQTNGILLNDEWCRFFHENNFLIGLSLDGPERTSRYLPEGQGRPGNLRPGHESRPVAPETPGGIQYPLHGQSKECRLSLRGLPVLPG